MSLKKFEAEESFLKTINEIDILLKYAIKERDNENEGSRRLFLKLAIVASVTKFQIFIESILKEYLYLLKNSNRKNKDLNCHLRLNSLKLYFDKVKFDKELANHLTYDDIKLNEVRNNLKKLNNFCKDNRSVDDSLKFETKFPMGKQGLKELKKLFRQINGEDIFDNDKTFDINKLNEILGRRHAIIHEDTNPQITEKTIEEYRHFLINLIIYISDYLRKHI